MKSFFTNSRFKLVAAIIALLLAGALLAGLTGRSETVQSSVVGTVLSPLHFVAQKISDGFDTAFGNVKPHAAYEKKVRDLEEENGDLKAKLADYEDMKKQNEMYKDVLELKEEKASYQFVEASVIARDSADIYKSFSISKGSVSGIKVGNAVIYKKNLIGIIDKVYPDYSVVKTILNPKFNVSAYEIISGEISYVTGNARLARDGKCKMSNLSSTTHVAYGSIICSAGIGDKIPKGLVIGTVDEVADEPADISSYARIVPEVEIDEISQCFVVTDF